METSITTFNTWKYIVPLTIVVLAIGLVLSFFEGGKVSFFANVLILTGILLFFYSLYLFSSR